MITKVEIAAKDPMGNVARPGYQILQLWFASADGSQIDASKFMDAARNGVYVTGDDGSQTKTYAYGMVSGKYLVGFTPPTSAHKFVLHWPNNPPIELEFTT
jgi:hypothetical protein